jgi:hypothetical protein
MSPRGKVANPPRENRLEVYLRIGHETERCAVGDLKVARDVNR